MEGRSRGQPAIPPPADKDGRRTSPAGDPWSPRSPLGGEASLYLHVPFCVSCCDYCDFYSIPWGAPREEDPRLLRFVDRLLAAAEEALRRSAVKIVPTAYIGGGTPSILGAGGLARLLSGLRSLWGKPPVEITLEVNPESAGEALLRAAREGGVTRISLGVQSFHGPSRRAVGRAGEEELLHSRLRLVQEIFPGAYSADLIAGLPVQSWAVLLRDLETLLAYEPAHVSLYALTVEEGTPLEGRVKRDRTLLPSPEEADRIWLAGRDFLEAAGYGQYEVSNFALPGKRSLHNIRYWRMKNWLGIGPSASGTLIDEETGSGWRLTQRPSTESWLAPGPLPEPEREFLDPLTLMKESLLMGFRYVEGPGGERFKNRFGRSLSASIPRTRAAWEKRGFFAPPGRGAGLRPSREGLLFLDAFLRDAFAELDTTG